MKQWIGVMAFVVVSAVIGVLFVFKPHLPAAERGRRLAERTGCFACHGPEGLRGTANPGRTDAAVPGFEGDVVMFAHGPDELREWIRDGVTAKRAKSQTWREQRDKGALKMPAFKTRLNEGQIEDLVAFVMVESGAPEPDDSLALRGIDRAEALGCVGCHGPGGRLARRNPGSLKGYIPSWDGQDFPELVASRVEFDQWVEDGVSERFKSNPMARYFLGRAVLKMPAFRGHIETGDLDALWAYIEWLRSPDQDGNAGHASEGE